MSDEIKANGKPWPQTQPPLQELSFKYPNHKTRGFLPPLLINPLPNFTGEENPQKVSLNLGNYKYTDWRGQILELSPNMLHTKDRFIVSRDLPKTTSQLLNKPYSTRDHYLIFDDNSQDYFRHGLQIQNASFLKSVYSKGTPFENSDPVMFGFEIIFDDISSPLLNGSINDFLQLFSGNISEIAARQPVYEEFKQQFIKFFKTKATVRRDSEQTRITSPDPYAEADNNTNVFNSGKKAYMNYYLKKVTGLSKLIEGNTAEAKNFLVEYNKDIITLSFTEDVSLSVGTLAHLYKLLYWSRPNAKSMIPENLLRFNCDIIVSEVRNYNRVKKSLQEGKIEVVKDNVSRYIYSLKECQFYFNTLPHDDTIDLGAIKVFDSYDIQFDYKYSTVKFERFVPATDGFGTYAGYDGGAIWKIGNSGSRESQTGGTPSKYGKSIPAFFTIGQNKFNQNGVNEPIITSVPGRTFVSEETQSREPNIEDLKQNESKNKTLKDVQNENLALYDNDIETKPVQFTGQSLTEQLFNKELNQIYDKESLDKITTGDSESEIEKIRKKQYEEARDVKLPENQLNLYNPPEGFQITTTEESLKKQKQGVKLSTKLRNALSRELQSAVNTRVGILNKSLNKILNSVGITGVSPPKNIYKGTQTGAGRIFNDIRGQLIEFIGDATGNLLQ